MYIYIYIYICIHYTPETTTNEHPLENAAENVLDIRREHPLGK